MSTGLHAPDLRLMAPAAPLGGAPDSLPFRFYDNRQKYLAFVNTCNEKAAVARRVVQELSNVRPCPPALRVFDAGMGDGTVLSRVMQIGRASCRERV